jgi:glycosyltransferase involved in cell wall biosynthesis
MQLMEILIPHTPLAFVIIAFVALVAGVKIMQDIKVVRASRRTHSLIMRYVTKKNTPKISVLVELRRTADAIFPFLDHLYQYNYPELEVIVVVNHTAGKYAQTKLSYYRRKHHRKNLRIIKHSKGMDTNVVVRRFASSSFVIKLQLTDRLSKDFFNNLSIELLHKEIDVFIPRTHIAIGKTLVSAVCAVNGIWRHMLVSLNSTPTTNKTRIESGRIYRRRSLLVRSELHGTYIPRLAIHQTSINSWKLLLSVSTSKLQSFTRSRNVQVFIIAGVLFMIGLGGYLWGQDLILLAGLILLLYVVAYLQLLFELKGYSTLDRLSLLLFAPFSALFLLFVAVYSSTAGTRSRIDVLRKKTSLVFK